MVSVPAAWTLDPQLEHDTLMVGDLPLCQIRLMNDANYPWLILVPRRHAAVEITDLADVDQVELIREISNVTRALQSCSACDKINVAAIGNVVPQLHVHVIARHSGDAAWPRTVWGQAPVRPYEGAARDKRMYALRQHLGFAG